ncbi:uncharacterized protein LOC141674601 [Apium graveolens]|uniref:uncharacterized protein LOC141674601 n=1 Tax=Apium graveolens TaxID=4045 RepID=UPI003D7C10BA
MANNESVKDITSKFAKLDKFEGHDFRRWQKKMHFLLTTSKVVYVLSAPMPKMIEEETVEQTRRRCKWENDDYICRGHILNGMSDSLFDIYQNVESAKELWDSLESKYMAEDASSKKFLVSNFINYKMVDTRPIMEQYNELLRILGQFVQHDMKMDESISVSSVINKLPPSWKDFKHTLKHNKEEMTLVELGSHFRIEEALRAQEIENNRKGNNQVGNSSVNMVEDGGSSKNSNKDNGKKRKFKENNNTCSNKKPKLACWKCGKSGYFKKDFRVGKGKYNAGLSGSKDPEKQQGQILVQNYNSGQNYMSLISKALYVQDDNVAWWIDSGATSHVCKDLRWFEDFQPIEDGSILKMGNVATEPIKGLRNVKLFFTSGKYVLLNNVLIPTKRNKFTPYELWYKEPQKLSFLRVWGCRAVVRLTEPKRRNLGERGLDCIFVAYAEHSIAYRLYVLEPNDYEPGSTEDVHGPSEPRRRFRARKNKSFGPDFQLYLVEGSRDEVEIKSEYQYCFIIEEDPKTFNEAMTSRDVAFWKEAIQDEMVSIMNNNTWELSDLPSGCKALGNRWIFKRKMKVDGTIDKFKARLVIQGFRQKEGIDYFDTYAPVARISTIRLLIALASIHNLVIHQMDVKTAFLNGELDEEIYIKQPEGFVMSGSEHKVCKLKKSLYGLKQAPKDWNQKFDSVVLSNGFLLNQADKCVYSKFDASGKGVIICLYVDDMLIFGTDQNQVDKTKKFLSSNFDMKDLGEAEVILGIKIKRTKNSISISQSHYIEKILKRFNFNNCSPVSTPIDPSLKLVSSK